MNQKLVEIQNQLESLGELIKDYLSSSKEDRIVLKKENFSKLKHVGIINQGKTHVFEYDGICIFKLNTYFNDYEKIHYEKLMDGTLERLIISKKSSQKEIEGFSLNYEIEALERTKLFDLYGKSDL